jgi:uncharacterized protein YjbI with pentapeptide repeats
MEKIIMTKEQDKLIRVSTKEISEYIINYRTKPKFSLNTYVKGIAAVINCNLSEFNLAEANLSNVIFINTVLEKANLSGAYLKNASFNMANLTSANLSRAILINSNLNNANLYKANLDNAILFEASLDESILVGASLKNANLSRATLKNSKLMGADLPGANLSRANLTGANLSSAYLRGADLRGANLTGVDLSNADLTGANLTGANLNGAILDNTDLRGANLFKANLLDAYLVTANLNSALLINATHKPSNVNYKTSITCVESLILHGRSNPGFKLEACKSLFKSFIRVYITNSKEIPLSSDQLKSLVALENTKPLGFLDETKSTSTHLLKYSPINPHSRNPYHFSGHSSDPHGKTVSWAASIYNERIIKEQKIKEERGILYHPGR